MKKTRPLKKQEQTGLASYKLNKHQFKEKVVLLKDHSGSDRLWDSVKASDKTGANKYSQILGHVTHVPDAAKGQTKVPLSDNVKKY